jgi:hypothetical protein
VSPLIINPGFGRIPLADHPAASTGRDCKRHCRSGSTAVLPAPDGSCSPPTHLPRNFVAQHRVTAISSFAEASFSFGVGNPVPGERVGTGQHVLLYYSTKIRKLPSVPNRKGWKLPGSIPAGGGGGGGEGAQPFAGPALGHLIMDPTCWAFIFVPGVRNSRRTGT